MRAAKLLRDASLRPTPQRVYLLSGLLRTPDWRTVAELRKEFPPVVAASTATLERQLAMLQAGLVVAEHGDERDRYRAQFSTYGSDS